MVIVRNVGPKGDPGMLLLQRFLWQLAAKGKSDKIAFMTDGRFSGTNKGCAVAHISPEAATGGPLGLVEDGDIIEIDIPNRTIKLAVSDDELAQRRTAMDAKGSDAWKPLNRERVVSQALKAYAALTTSASRGAVRDISQLEK